MKEVGICGAFGDGKAFSGGQPVKVKMIIEEMQRVYGINEVKTVNTWAWKRNPLKLLLGIFLLTLNCKNIIILPARNGVQIIIQLFLFANRIFSRNIHYIVVGGWLPAIIKNNNKLKKQIGKLRGIYVETKSMLKELEEIGLNNVIYMPNCKRLEVLDDSELVYNLKEPYRVCYYSRITPDKGIEDAINAIQEINKRINRTVYILDIYGPVHYIYRKKFLELQKSFPDYIRYCGVKEPYESVNILKNYFLQLFPTHFLTEGVPGSIIDSYFAGVPVLAPYWNSYKDVIDENETGIGYKFNDYSALVAALVDIAENPQKIVSMKRNCIQKAKIYMPDSVIRDFIQYLSVFGAANGQFQ
jgi:Glycosyltransferase